MENKDAKTHVFPQADESMSPEARAFIIQRNASRRMAVQILYALDVNNSWQDTKIAWASPTDGQPQTLDEWDTAKKEQLDTIFNIINDENNMDLTRDVLRKAWARARKICLGIAENKQKIDAMIIDAAQNWSLARIDLVDRSIMRLAIFEMTMATPLVKPAVAINEAIEIAKEYGKKDSGRFVNGVLDKIRKDIQQAPFTVGNE